MKADGAALPNEEDEVEKAGTEKIVKVALEVYRRQLNESVEGDFEDENEEGTREERRTKMRRFERPQTYPNNSFSRHRTTAHTRDSAPEFEVVVLHRHIENTLHRKIMEAREIKRCQPEINNREELAEALKLIA
ncbi:hypothetical protein Y032_0041g485 [Ancylostoma ceylanicum]|nr:hypothetical protein Y032_0041g485 [Ancylostoma ceylanicum]